MGLIGWLTGAAPLLDRILDQVDKKVDSETERQRIKADLIAEHYRTRPDWMKAGGFVLMLLFAVPLAVHFAAVVLYGLLWCKGCIYPQTWTIAALPQPLDEWAGLIVMSIFGVVSVSSFRR